MLYSLLFPLADQIGAFNVFRYITFRTAMAAVTALVISLALGPATIRVLKRFQIAQSIRAEGPKTHLDKAGTPPQALDVQADVTFVPGTGITGVHLTVSGKVDGISPDGFVAAAEDAKKNCPVSQALAVPITMDASLA